jgi:branched-chain amino acid aminotransferase
MTVFWMNGSLRTADDAVVSVLDHGLTVGDGIFETLLVRDGAPFALRRHIERLFRSGAGMQLTMPAEADIRQAVRSVVDAAGDEAARARLRVTVTSGVGPLGSERGDAPPTLIVTLTAAKEWGATTTIATVPWTRNENSAVVGVKTTSYAENAVALAEAHRRGASEAIVANTRGELCEGTGSNVFVVIDGVVHTPSLDTGCLAGITRELVLEWGPAVAEHRESRLPFESLFTADEIFITSSTRDVHPVTRVDDREVAVGPVTELVAAEFARRMAEGIDP